MKITIPKRKILPLLLAVAVALLLNACLVSSIRPFYFEHDVVEVPYLVGTWSTDDETWTLREGEEGYLWHVVEDDETHLLEATFFTFQDVLFFDFTLDEDEYSADEDVELFTVRTHSVARVRLESGELYLDHLSLEFLEEALESGSVDLTHYRDPDDRIVLTGSTTELQDYLAWCMPRPGCLDDGPDDSEPMTRSR